MWQGYYVTKIGGHFRGSLIVKSKSLNHYNFPPCLFLKKKKSLLADSQLPKEVRSNVFIVFDRFLEWYNSWCLEPFSAPVTSVPNHKAVINLRGQDGT